MQKKQEHKNTRAKEQKIFTFMPYALMAFALILSGCGRQQHRASEPVFISSSSAANIDKAKTMELAEEVLTDMYFDIEKADLPNGLIRTRPLSGAQFFEFWRSDNVGAENSLLANMHTIRRTVEIDITQQGPQFRIDCEVRVQRLSLPEREAVNSSGRIYEMYSLSSPSLQTLQFEPEQEKGMAWIDLGADAQLAAEILKRIQERIEIQANETTVTGNNS